MSLADLLFDHPFGDNAALIHTVDRAMTAGEARVAARAVAGRLQDAGVAPGQAVAVQLPNGPEFITTMAGIWLAGAVLVPLNARTPEAERRALLQGTEAAALVRTGSLERLPGARVHEAGTAFVLWTSGTTGPPKPILHTHTAYLELLDRVLGPLRSARRDPGSTPSANLIPVPLALNAGLYNALFGLRAGAPLVLMETFETGVFTALIRRFAIRSTVLPPACIIMLNDDPAVDGLGPLRYVRSITAPLSPLQARRFTERFGVTVLNGYGQAETGEVIGWTATDAKEHPEKLGAAGRPHSGVAIRIVGSDGSASPAGEIGQLWVRPPRTALGLEDRLDADGYVDTGDLARMDADGFIWIEGRAGEVINRGGNKVFPAQVEEVLRLAPQISDAAVVGIADDRLGEVPVAFYTGAPVEPGELTELCRDHLVPYKVPAAFHHVPVLPKNEAGKVLRRELVARLSAAQPRP